MDPGRLFFVLAVAGIALGVPARAVSAHAAPTVNPFLESGAEDPGWPFLRGPNYDGRSPEIHLADAWPAEGPPVLWTRPLGQGFSGFVAWDGRVATQYQTLGGQFVVCLDADSGQTIWQHRYQWPYDPAGVYPGPRATPTYAQGCVYFASPTGLVGCLDAEDGKRRWTVDLPAQFGGRGTDFGYSCSPTVVAGKVLLPVGGPGAGMVALSAADGSPAWKAGDEPASYTPAYPITFRERPLVIGYMQNALVCHDLESGDLVWRHVLSSGYDEHSAWPIYWEPYLWISGPFQSGSELLELTGEASRPIKTVRKSRAMSNDVASSVLVDGAVYGFDLREAQVKTHRPSRGRFRCVDFLSGDEYWAAGDNRQRRIDADRSADMGTRIGHATVIAADGKLFLLNDTGDLILARASKERYEELGRAAVLNGEIGWTQPTLYRGRIFLRNHSRAACVYVGEPELIEPAVLAAAVAASDIPQTRYVDVAGVVLGVEPEYAFDVPSLRWLRNWFVVSLVGIIGSGWVVAAALGWRFPRRMTPNRVRWLFWSIVFVLGALGTTLLGRWLGEFVFTWPVSLFVAFQAVVWETGPRGSARQRASRWRTGAVVLGFAATCLVYFLLCRRLSLVFEWVFLCGFLGGLPFALAGKSWFQRRRWRWLWEASMTAAAFAGFYGLSAAVLWLKQ